MIKNIYAYDIIDTIKSLPHPSCLQLWCDDKMLAPGARRETLICGHSTNDKPVDRWHFGKKEIQGETTRILKSGVVDLPYMKYVWLEWHTDIESVSLLYSVICLYIRDSTWAFVLYRDVKWTSWRPKSRAIRLFAQHLVSVHLQKASKLRITGPFGESTGDRWILLTKVQ